MLLWRFILLVCVSHITIVDCDLIGTNDDNDVTHSLSLTQSLHAPDETTELVCLSSMVEAGKNITCQIWPKTRDGLAVVDSEFFNIEIQSQGSTNQKPTLIMSPLPEGGGQAITFTYETRDVDTYLGVAVHLCPNKAQQGCKEKKMITGSPYRIPVVTDTPKLSLILFNTTDLVTMDADTIVQLWGDLANEIPRVFPEDFELLDTKQIALPTVSTFTPPLVKVDFVIHSLEVDQLLKSLQILIDVSNETIFIEKWDVAAPLFIRDSPGEKYTSRLIQSIKGGGEDSTAQGTPQPTWTDILEALIGDSQQSQDGKGNGKGSGQTGSSSSEKVTDVNNQLNTDPIKDTTTATGINSISNDVSVNPTLKPSGTPTKRTPDDSKTTKPHPTKNIGGPDSNVDFNDSNGNAGSSHTTSDTWGDPLIHNTGYDDINEIDNTNWTELTDGKTYVLSGLLIALLLFCALLIWRDHFTKLFLRLIGAHRAPGNHSGILPPPSVLQNVLQHGADDDDDDFKEYELGVGNSELQLMQIPQPPEKKVDTRSDIGSFPEPLPVNSHSGDFSCTDHVSQKTGGSNGTLGRLPDHTFSTASSAYNELGILPVAARRIGNALEQLLCIETLDQNGDKNDLQVSWSEKMKLAKGGQGSVFLGIVPTTGATVAVKIIDRKQFSEKKITNEFWIHKKLSHPNIVKLFGWQVANDSVKIVTEYMVSDLSTKLQYYSIQKIPHPTIALYASHILQGVHYLHANGIIHRDLKPGNFLTANDGTIKIGDFGVSIMDVDVSQLHSLKQISGTASYSAPETIKGEYSYATDVWAIGCCVYEMFTLKSPWEQQRRELHLGDISLLHWIHQHGKSGPDLSKVDCSPEALDFMTKCFASMWSERPTTTQLLNHPWFSVLDKSGLCTTTTTTTTTSTW